MAIDALAGISSSTPAAVPTLAAEGLRSVTLGQMLSSRLEGAIAAQIPSVAPTSPTSSAVGQTPSVAAPPSLGAIDTPAELKAYGNGKLPRELLTPIGIGQHRLWGPAAQSFISMRTAAASTGVQISVTDSYRNYDQQVELAARKGLTQNGGWAAVPGTSEHGWGLAVDMDVNGAGLAWLKTNGATFGWVQPTTREPWHWEFHGTPDAPSPITNL